MKRPFAVFGLMTVGLFVTACGADAASPSMTPAYIEQWPGASSFTVQMQQLERAYDARLGVAVIDVTSDVAFGYHESERFAYASTFKALLAGIALHELSEDELDEVLTWTQEQVDEAGYAPATTDRVGQGMSIRDLAEATVRTSDNMAANLLISRLGGPAAVDALLAKAGDATTDFVDIEPALNTVPVGTTANTTTPAAFATALERIALGDYLEPENQALLRSWMSDNVTGDPLIRAGVPTGWDVTDKSGGAGSVRNDIAIAYSDVGAPVVVVVMTAKNDPSEPFDNGLVADVAAAVFATIP